MMMITGYGDSLVTTTGSCTAVLLTGCQVPRKAMFQVMDTRGYLIIGRETVRKLGYIHIPKITPSRLIQQPKMYAHMKAIKMKALKHRVISKEDQGLKCPRIQLLNGVMLIDGKRHSLPITKEYVLDQYGDVLSGVGTLPGK